MEARGESIDGSYAVASVIWNRAGGNPEKLKTVCLAPRQFSCWNKGYTKAKPRNKAERAILCELEALEGQMFNGTFKPSTKADHYLRFDCFPAWRKELKNQVRIGNHIFGNCK